MHFLHTSSILSVSLFEIAKLALAKRYAHCCFVNNDACRVGGLKKIRIRVPTAAGRTFFCAPRLAWGCQFCHLMRIPERESQF